ncbi:MAG TPA: TolC family protein [Terriglobales bacterium]|nr:TolC family protein [Terriglobales bacterium]
MRVASRKFLPARAVFVLFALGPAAHAQELTFRHAIELALQHSGAMAIANADQARARASMQEARNAYIPALTVGSGLAWTYGFPLSIEGSAPSIVNFNSQSMVYNAPQHEFIQAARRDWLASRFSTQDRRNRVILETSEVYSELDNAESSLKILAQQQQAAQKAQQIVSDRVREGVDSELELTRVKLVVAKVEMKTAESQGAADTARVRLAQLTGLPTDSIHTLTESIPALPEVDQSADLSSLAVKASPVVQQASEQAESKRFRAKGEHKMNYPAVDFVAQYGLFSKANNFQEFFSRFQRNNATVGAAIRIPFFNLSQKAHAEAADAEALAAKKQSQDVQDEIANQTLRLQRSVRQLAAAKEIARLEHQLAQADVESAQAQVQSGNASLKDVASAQVKEQESYIGYLDAALALEKAQLEQMDSTNE